MSILTPRVLVMHVNHAYQPPVYLLYENLVDVNLKDKFFEILALRGVNVVQITACSQWFREN